jgi:DNA-binding GntR family transcriptional regulator
MTGRDSALPRRQLSWRMHMLEHSNLTRDGRSGGRSGDVKRLEHAGAKSTRNMPMCFIRVKELSDLWDARCCLESLAAKLACSHLSEADLALLRELCCRRERAADMNDQRTVDRVDAHFHRRIIELSQNEIVASIFRTTRLLERIFAVDYPVPSYWPPDEQAPYAHREIIEAMARGEDKLVERLMEAQIRAGKSRRLAALRDELIPYDNAVAEQISADLNS